MPKKTLDPKIFNDILSKDCKDGASIAEMPASILEKLCEADDVGRYSELAFSPKACGRRYGRGLEFGIARTQDHAGISVTGSGWQRQLPINDPNFRCDKIAQYMSNNTFLGEEASSLLETSCPRENLCDAIADQNYALYQDGERVEFPDITTEGAANNVTGNFTDEDFSLNFNLRNILILIFGIIIAISLAFVLTRIVHKRRHRNNNRSSEDGRSDEPHENIPLNDRR